MQEPSSIYALIEHEDGWEALLVRVCKSSVRYWDSKKPEEAPEIYQTLKD